MMFEDVASESVKSAIGIRTRVSLSNNLSTTIMFGNFCVLVSILLITNQYFHAVKQLLGVTLT